MIENKINRGFEVNALTLSWRRLLSYRNEPIDLLSKLVLGDKWL